MLAFRPIRLGFMGLAVALITASNAIAQARSSGTVNGINYTVIGGGSQSISGSGDGIEIIANGTVIQVLRDAISVNGARYPVAEFGMITVDQTGGALEVSVDGRLVMTQSAQSTLAERAEAGDLVAMNTLSIALFQGDGMDADPARAEALLRAAAEGGNLDAQSNLANRLGYGQGLPENREEAFMWAARAADAGHAYAQYTVAKMLIYGVGTPIDAPRAVTYFEGALALGLGEAATELGYIHSNGIEVPVDYPLAVSYYEQGLALDNARAGFNLAAVAVQTSGQSVSPEAGLAALERAIELGWDSNLSEMRAALAELQTTTDQPGARFFYADGGNPVGPLTFDAMQELLRNGTISRQTLTWEGGTEAWRALGDQPAFNN